MGWKKASVIALLGLVVGAPWAVAAPVETSLRLPDSVPSWGLPAVRFALQAGYVDKSGLHPNRPMPRTTFKRIMGRAFGGGYHRTTGNVTAGEVDAALVRALGKQGIARRLTRMKGPGGWDPRVGKRFGTEIVAREIGLRYNRPPGEEQYEAGAWDPMAQVEVLWAVWKAKTSPSLYGADALTSFRFASYNQTQRKVIDYALSQVGVPYIWGGEWPTRTPSGYPYGAQPAGGLDCSGFSWIVLREKASGWSPPQRGYRGWSLPQRASSEMAAATPKRARLGYRELRPGDLVFFAPNGAKSGAAGVYHAGVYLGRGWMIDSAGGQAGVSLSDLGPGSWYRDQFVWGRRIIRT